MYKRLALIVVLFFAATVAKADNIVSVTLDPMDFGDFFSQTGQELGHEIVGVNFTWDTTTQVLSNFVVSSTGPFTMPNAAADVLFGSDGSLWVLDINGPSGSQYQFDFLTMTCFRCLPFPEHTLRISVSSATACPGGSFELGTATVSAIPTPEPGSAALLLTGLVALPVLLSRRRKAIAGSGSQTVRISR